jgi:hypothetical protein
MTLGQTFFWAVTKFPYPNGHLVILGPYGSREECESKSYQELENPFDVVELSTRNRSAATAILKKRNLSNTSDLGSSLARAGHQPPKAPGTTPDISPNDPYSPY